MLSQPIRKSTPLTFSHFSRKNYALFACLGREVRIGVLTVATLASAAPCLAHASAGARYVLHDTEDTTDSGEVLEEAVVSASRAPLAADVTARPVMTLTRQELAAAGVTSINDVLKLAAGVDVRQRGGFGIQTDISIDGGTFDQIALLVNGIAITNPQTGHNAADFPVNIQDIERVEILRGAASRVFGSQAFSGAINVVTRHGGDRVSAEVSGGSYGTLLASARLAGTVTPHFTTSASGSYQRSDGAVSNGAFSGAKAFWQGRYEDDLLRLDAQAGLTTNDFGANTFYSAAYTDQWEATRRYLLAVKAETKGRIHLAPQVSWLRSSDHYQLIHGSSRGENFHRGDVYTAGINAWTQWAAGRTAVGTELRQEGIYSTNLGRTLSDEECFPIHGHNDIFYTHRDTRTNVSYFVEHNVVLRSWTLSAGVMAQRNTSTARTFRFYPGVDLTWRPTDHWHLYASWNRSMRLPTFTDWWYKSPTQEGNIGLRPEECSAWRLGTTGNYRILQLNVDAHFTRGTNMIDWVMYSADDIYHATSFNLDNVGASATATVNFDQWLGRRQPLSRLRLDYAYLYQHRRSGPEYFKSNYALEYLRHKMTVVLDHRIVSHLAATWSLRLQQREGSYLLYHNGQSTGEQHAYGTHALLDCKVHWDTPRYGLFVDLTNLTSHRYFDLANVRQPGFMVMAGASWRLP
jgi:iron complex outermembrane receptor protein